MRHLLTLLLVLFPLHTALATDVQVDVDVDLNEDVIVDSPKYVGGPRHNGYVAPPVVVVPPAPRVDYYDYQQERIDRYYENAPYAAIGKAWVRRRLFVRPPVAYGGFYRRGWRGYRRGWRRGWRRRGYKRGWRRRHRARRHWRRGHRARRRWRRGRRRW